MTTLRKPCHPKSIYRPTINYPESHEHIDLYLHDICADAKISGQLEKMYTYKGGDKSATENIMPWDYLKPSYFLMCLDEKGQSYTVQIDDYYYPIKIILPKGTWSNETCRRFVSFIQNEYKIKIFSWSIEINQKTSQYEPDPENFPYPLKHKVIRLDVGTIQKAKKLKKCLRDPVIIPTIHPNSQQLYHVEEDYISESLNLLIDSHLKPSKWFRLDKWEIPTKFYSNAQIEIKTKWKDVKPLDDKITIPPLIVAGFDIETDNPEGFASPGTQPVICISTFICRQGIPSSEKTFTHYLRYPYKHKKYPYVDYLDEKNMLENQEESAQQEKSEQDVKNEQEEKNREEEFIEKNISIVEANNCIPDEDIKPKGEIFYFDDEKEMLMHWYDFFVHRVDPDVLTGHNIFNYDIPYIFLRMGVLENLCFVTDLGKISGKHRIILDSLRAYRLHEEFLPGSNFFYFSKLHDLKTPLVSSVFDSKGQGDNDNTRLYCPGRVQIDLLQVMKRHPYLKMVDNKLKTISTELLGHTKEDVNAAYLHNIWRSNMSDTIIAYCETDAQLPVLNLNSTKLNHILQSIEHARLLYSTLDETINRGTTYTLTNLLTATCRHWGYVIDIGAKDEGTRKELRTIRINHENTGEREYFSDDEDVMGPRLDEDGKARKFKGAKVVDPMKGCYEVVVVWDFASLYPSIMMAYNLDSCTQIVKKDKYGMHDFVEKILIEGGGRCGTDRTNMFVKSDVDVGVLPRLLKNLYYERKGVKRKMYELELEAETTGRELNKELHIQYDAKQLATKLVMNSSYGAKAAKNFAFGSRRVSECTTAIGRLLINKVIGYIKEKYIKLDPEIVYGDTDSVMIKFKMEKSKYENLYHGYEIGMELAKNIKGILPEMVSLDFEKVYAPFFISDIKKVYIGKKYEVKASFKPPETYPTDKKGWKDLCHQTFNVKTDCRGYCIRKKGEPPVIRKVVQNVINMFLEMKSPEEVLQYLSIELSKIANNEYPIESFVQYKKLQRTYRSKNVLPSHAIVNQKIKYREPGSEHHPGDFVPHVHLTPKSANKLYPHYSVAQCQKYKSYCAEDVDYAKIMVKTTNHVKINYEKYILLIKTDCSRLFSVIPQYTAKFNNLFDRTIQEIIMSESQLYNFYKSTYLNTLNNSVTSDENVNENQNDNGMSKSINNVIAQDNIVLNNFKLNQNLTQGNRLMPEVLLNTKARGKNVKKRKKEVVDSQQVQIMQSFLSSIKKQKHNNTT